MFGKHFATLPWSPIARVDKSVYRGRVLLNCLHRRTTILDVPSPSGMRQLSYAARRRFDRVSAIPAFVPRYGYPLCRVVSPTHCICLKTRTANILLSSFSYERHVRMKTVTNNNNLSRRRRKIKLVFCPCTHRSRTNAISRIIRSIKYIALRNPLVI